MPFESNINVIPHLKAFTEHIDSLTLQEHGTALRIYWASLKIGILLHIEATVRFDLIFTVSSHVTQNYPLPAVCEYLLNIRGSKNSFKIEPKANLNNSFI